MLFRRRKDPDRELEIALRRASWAARNAMDKSRGDRELVLQAVLVGLNEWEIVNTVSPESGRF